MNKVTVWRNGWGIAILAVMLVGSRVFADASFQGLGYVGSDTESYANAVSGDGSVVVGLSKSGSDYHAFRWTASGGMIDLGGGSVYANGVSEDGSVVVGSTKSGSIYEAFRWTESGGAVGLDDLPGGSVYSEAYGVSANGAVIIGTSSSASGTEGFYWNSGVMTGLNDSFGRVAQSEAYGVSADGKVVVGRMPSGSSYQAFRWTQGGGMDPLGYLDETSPVPYSMGYAASADGSVVVGSSFVLAIGGQKAFRWTELDGMVSLDDLHGSDGSIATAVSADGSIIVGYGFSALSVQPFIWDEANGMRSLEDLLTGEYGLDLTGWTLREATAISANGLTIVGYGTHNGYTEAWIATLPSPVPLPGAVLLGSLGLVSSGLYLRRRIT